MFGGIDCDTKDAFLVAVPRRWTRNDCRVGSEQDMAPSKRRGRPIASRHLVCGTCRSWIQFESSGCGKTWAETRGESFAFTCKGCTEVTALVNE